MALEDDQKPNGAYDNAPNCFERHIPRSRKQEGRKEMTIEPRLSRGDRKHDADRTGDGDYCFQAVPAHVDMVV